MKLYANVTLEEGSCFPLAWIAIVHMKPPIASYFIVRFPWFKRDRNFMMRDKYAWYTPALFVSHFKGCGPEKYEFTWLMHSECEF